MDKVVCMIVALYPARPGLVFAVDSPTACEQAQAKAKSMNKATADDESVFYVLMAGKPCKFSGSCKEDEQ